MPHPTKKQKIDDHQRTDVVVAAGNNFLASFDDLSIDVLANIFKFLPLDEIMCSRCLNKKSREAVKMTIVPLGDFRVHNIAKYHAMAVMTRAMPNLQQITLRGLGYGYKYSDGEDPVAQRYDDWISHDIDIISNFRKLRILNIDLHFNPGLNGRYPVFFNFPLLQKLSINECGYLKWDLEMLSGMPLLKELECSSNRRLTGKISSLRGLKDTLEKVTIYRCENVEGKLMDLADFPHLKKLDLFDTAITGDIRDIGNNDFSSLEELSLPEKVFGGSGYEFQRISDVHDLIRAVYLLRMQRPALVNLDSWSGVLSKNSPDWYESAYVDQLPFYIGLVQAGSRIGYRWESCDGSIPCEVNWLDPEPDSESSDYDEYMEELREINSHVKMYRGFHQPPTEEEYDRLIEVLQEEGRWW